MLTFNLLCRLAPEGLVRFFNPDPAVVAFGSEYMRIISWNFAASGIIFVSSSVFQGMGNTLPALASSSMRLLLFALPAYLLSRQPGFQMRHVWWLSVAAITIQLVVNILLLHREFTLKLGPRAASQPAPLVAET